MDTSYLTSYNSAPSNSQRTQPFVSCWERGPFKYGNVRGFASIDGELVSDEPNTVGVTYADGTTAILPVSHFRRTRNSRVTSQHRTVEVVPEVVRFGLIQNIGEDYSN